jgi:hypothetical protein
VRIALGLTVDIAFILLFAAIGRRNHGEDGGLLAVATTAWPFLVGMTIGWVAALVAVHRAPPPVRRVSLRIVEGVAIWFCTVLIGMVLRDFTHAGTPPAFIAVATVFLGVALVGWRVLAGFAESPRS